MKTYVLMISRVFPSTHKRKSEPTFFTKKIEIALDKYEAVNLYDEGIKGRITIDTKKIHTIRSNYNLWAKRIKNIQDGKAILSLRLWDDKPYRSEQVEFCRLDKDSGIGVQKLEFSASGLIGMIKIDDTFPENISYHIQDLAKNDGLSEEDFKEWFKKYDLSQPMAIIHFTNFRY